ncbi:MAG TPA: hypothetical protein VHD91_10420 [Gaiellaceae bacterium]|nr:hypothetical protein [Gaiellaceae bacterium]
MRRLVFISLVLVGLALPAAALAHVFGPSDGTLVVRNADNGDGAAVAQNVRPVVSLVITGFAIGHVDSGRIEIYDLDPQDDATPEVTSADSHKDVTHNFGDPVGTLTGTRWSGSTFSFRAADGQYRILIYGSGVYLFAGGKGNVWLTGNPTAPLADGSYSLNGDPWHSLTDTGKSGLAIAAANG